jgi:hypothetical protein
LVRWWLFAPVVADGLAQLGHEGGVPVMLALDPLHVLVFHLLLFLLAEFAEQTLEQLPEFGNSAGIR